MRMASALIWQSVNQSAFMAVIKSVYNSSLTSIAKNALILDYFLSWRNKTKYTYEKKIL